MSTSRRKRLWGLIGERSLSADVSITPALVCEVCAATVGVAGVWLTLMSGSRRSEPLSSTSAVSARLEELQLTIGEGPCVEAFESGGPVLVSDLASDADMARWPGFGRAAAEAGAAALFAFPLISGGIRMGVLALYRDVSGPLSSAELADALVFADLALFMMLNAHAQGDAGTLDASQEGLSGPRAEVYQATGMVAAQLAVSLEEAFARMRGHAFMQDLSLSQVAGRVVARSLRFDPDDV